jgi:hypothetical protein
MKFYDWKMESIRDGKGFHVDVGAFSTPIVGGGAVTIMDADRPELTVNVPELTTIIPIRIDVTIQVPLLAADVDECEILCGIDKDAVIAGGTYTTETPINMNIKHTNTSACTVRSAYTVNATAAPTLDLELIRSIKVGDVQTTAGVMWTAHKLLYIPTYPPIVPGPSCLALYWGGTVATSGFAQIEWIEYTSSDLN